MTQIASPTIAELLRRYRREAALTQEELAERASLSVRVIGKLERGEEHRPRKETVQLLADALELSPEERTQLQQAVQAARRVSPTEGTPAGRRTVLAPEQGTDIRTFLIADVRGYTRFTEEHGDEAAARLAARFAAICEQVVAARDGVVVELRGDEALAVFCSARQALHTAVELQRRLAQEADETLPLHVGIGLDAGEAVPVEGGYRGGALNLAARLCQLAGAGEVLVSEAVLHLARRIEGFEYLERGLVPLKGFADPVRVMQVRQPALTEPGSAPLHGAVSVDRPRQAAPPAPIANFLGALPPAPLVDREEEQERLRFALDTVEAGAGQLVLLVGEPGIGKTRLAQEVSIQARNRGFLVLTGRCYERCQSLPLSPFVEALTQAFMTGPPSIVTQARQRWPALCHLLEEQAGKADATPSIRPEDQRLFQATAVFLIALAAERPVALLLDDLHWADTTSLDLMQHVARYTRAERVLLLGTYRDTDLDAQQPLRQAVRDLTREHLVERLTLGRLTLEGTAAMVAGAIAETEGVSDFAEFVHRRTKGIPYFIDTMLQALGGHYRLLREIGEGGMGRVFEAVDTRTGERVAAKIMFSRTEAEQEAVRRFQQEGAVLAGLEHENIVKVKGTFIEEHASCIVMELLDGQSLRQIMAEEELSLARIKHLTVQVAAALAYAHEQHIIHRDVKADNVMVVGDDHVKVTDFGIARILRPADTLTTFTSTGMTLGTPLYMAPEQIEGKRVDGRADVYSLGAMLYHLVVGRPPFEGDDPLTVAYKHVHQAPEPPRSIDASIPEDWEALILKALAKSPAERFQSAAQMEAAIASLGDEQAATEQAEKEEPVSQPAASAADQPHEATASPARRRPVGPWTWPAYLRAIAALGVILALAVGLFLHQSIRASTALAPHTLLAVWQTQRSGSGTFQSPGIVRVGPQGDLFVLDGSNRTILKLSSGGALLAEWHLKPPAAVNGKVRVLDDLTVDRRGNMYVTDVADDTVKKLSPAGKLLATWGKPGSSLGEFAAPTGIAVDREGNLYVAEDLNYRIQKLSAQGRPLAQWGSAGTAPGQFLEPGGVAVDAAGNIYVADAGNNRIQKFSPSGQPLTQWGTRGSKPGQFNLPNYVQLDSRGNIYVADVRNRRIQKLSPAGKPLAEWGTTGATALLFRWPNAVAVDGKGDIYVADADQMYGQIDEMSPTGQVLQQWTQAELQLPLFQLAQYVTEDRSGNVYVSDTGSGQIDKFSRGGTLLDQWPTPAAGHPNGVAADGHGSVYVADDVGHIMSFSPTGRRLADWSVSGGPNEAQPSPAGVAIGPKGSIYVADTTSRRILELSPTGKTIAQWPFHDSGVAPPVPIDVAPDVHGNLWVTDAKNAHVIELSSTGKVLQDWRLTGTARIFGITVDRAGNVYVTSGTEPHVLVFSPSGKMITSWGTTGTRPGQFRDPSGIVVSRDGTILVVDTDNNRIEKFSRIG